MARYFRSVMVQVVYPDGLLKNDDPNPTGAGLTTPLTEIRKVIVSGCGVSHNVASYEEKSGEYAGVFEITEV